MAETAYQIDISGVVQGVGFRPFIFRLAKKYDLNGYVSNTSKGVRILVEGKKDILEGFLDSINEEKPKISFIDNIDIKDIKVSGIKDFTIKKSEKLLENSIFISSDLSTCTNCKNDIFDKNNRRYKYPFTTCTYAARDIRSYAISHTTDIRLRWKNLKCVLSVRKNMMTLMTGDTTVSQMLV